MIQNLLIAILLGLIGGTIPGPVLTAIFTEILQNNLTKSFRIVFLAFLSETLVALVSLLILSSLNFSLGFFNFISLFGAIILFWIGTSIYKIKSIKLENKVHFSFFKIFLMIVSNGVLWIFWITVCIPKALELKKEILFGQFIFLGLVEIGWLISTLGIAFIFSKFRSILLKPKIMPIIFKLFAFTFFYFALDIIYNSVNYFFNN